MVRQYKFHQLMMMLTNRKVFVMCSGKGENERYFFAQIAD